MGRKSLKIAPTFLLQLYKANHQVIKQRQMSNPLPWLPAMVVDHGLNEVCAMRRARLFGLFGGHIADTVRVHPSIEHPGHSVLKPRGRCGWG